MKSNHVSIPPFHPFSMCLGSIPPSASCRVASQATSWRPSFFSFIVILGTLIAITSTSISHPGQPSSCASSRYPYQQAQSAFTCQVAEAVLPSWFSPSSFCSLHMYLGSWLASPSGAGADIQFLLQQRVPVLFCRDTWPFASAQLRRSGDGDSHSLSTIKIQGS